MGFAVIVFSQGASAAGEEGSTLLKFELRQRHQVIVSGAIGALNGLRFLIDTGSNPSMVDKRIARKLGLVVQEGHFVAFGKKSRVLTAALPDIRVGPLHVRGVPAGIGDLSFLGGVDAIVGLDVLSRSSFSIDYETRQLTFGPLVAREPTLKLEPTPPFLTVQVALAGRPVRLIVDTGSGRLVLFERRVRDRVPHSPVHGEMLLNHLSGITRLRRVYLPRLDAGASTFKPFEAFLSDASVSEYPPDIDGVLGIRVLASKRAEFDFERYSLGAR
jgi:predicted aspartyl protease